MYKLIVFFLAIFIFTNCGSQEMDASEGLKLINAKESSIRDLSKKLKPGEIVPLNESDELIDLLLNFYRTNPQDQNAPLCLDKVHMIYSSTKRHEKSAIYGDTLVLEYPDYINRPLILESMANVYDMYIFPRDTSKVRYYNELLLKENKDISKEKREEIQFKLDNLELTLQEIIMKVNE